MELPVTLCRLDVSQRWSALRVSCMKPAGVCVEERVAPCLGWNRDARGRRRVRRAASALQEHTSVILGNV